MKCYTDNYQENCDEIGPLRVFERKNDVLISKWSKFFVISVTKLWIFLQKYPRAILITFTKMNPLHVLFDCIKINSKNDVINNCYSILFWINLQITKSRLISLNCWIDTPYAQLVSVYLCVPVQCVIRPFLNFYFDLIFE